MERNVTDKRMFSDVEPRTLDTCTVCRWQGTEMCPRETASYVGRYLEDPDRIFRASSWHTYCSRFYPTHTEQERRWEQLMEKMSENLPEGDDFY